MSDRAYRGEIDFERLSAYFRVLGVPTRIQLLHKLQRPHAVAEIHLPPYRQDRERRADRPLSRQAVEAHLRKLEETELVRARRSSRGGQPVSEYVVNQARLFTLVDEMRRLSLIRPAPGVAVTGSRALAATADVSAADPDVRLPEGPSLILASGPFESRAFALEGGGPWTIGRAGDAAVCLDFDPFVSGANAEVWAEGSDAGHRFFVRDLPGSRNGTMVNWRLLEKGEAVGLRGGDTMAVGRSLLVLRNV